MTAAVKLGLGLLVLIACMGLSLATGATWISPSAIVRSVWQPDALSAIEHVLLDTRLTRTLMAVAVGSSLAVAGALMQALTRNPLASPGLFGINAGATFSIIACSSLFALSSMSQWLWCAFIGAAVAGTIVWIIGNRGQGSLNPLRIVLAGAAITALFTAFSQALLVVNQDGLDTVLFWLAGSLSERDLATAAPLLICVVVALAGSLVLAGQVNVLNTGESIATALGQRTGLIRLLMSIVIIVLAGSAVALAGSIGFIGLLVPHMVRKTLSIDHRWLLPGCALLGATLLLLADTLARVVIVPQEVPVGVMTALFGAPFFIALVRRGHVMDRHLTLRYRGFSRQFSLTALIRLLIGATLTLLIALGSLAVGKINLSPATLLNVFTGQADASLVFIVEQLRMPRLVLAALVGAALAVSGSSCKASSAIRWLRRTCWVSPAVPVRRQCCICHFSRLHWGAIPAFGGDLRCRPCRTGHLSAGVESGRFTIAHGVDRGRGVGPAGSGDDIRSGVQPADHYLVGLCLADRERVWCQLAGASRPGGLAGADFAAAGAARPTGAHAAAR